MSVRCKLVNWSIDVKEQQMIGGRKRTTWHLRGIEYLDLFMIHGEYVYTAPIKNVVMDYSIGTVDIFTEKMQYHNTLKEMSPEENHMRSCVLFIDEPLHKEGITIYFDLDNMNLFDRIYCKERDKITYSFCCLKSKMVDKVTVKCGDNYVTLCVAEEEDMHFKMIVNAATPHVYVANVGKRNLCFSCAGKEYELKQGESTEVVR